MRTATIPTPDPLFPLPARQGPTVGESDMPRHALADLQLAFGICPDAAARLDALMLLDWSSASDVLEEAIEAMYHLRFRRYAQAA